MGVGKATNQDLLFSESWFIGPPLSLHEIKNCSAGHNPPTSSSVDFGLVALFVFACYRFNLSAFTQAGKPLCPLSPHLMQDALCISMAQPSAQRHLRLSLWFPDFLVSVRAGKSLLKSPWLLHLPTML